MTPKHHPTPLSGGDRKALKKELGKARAITGILAAQAGAYYYWISRGVDDREVRANRIRKSVGAENTFSSDLTDFDAMTAELQPLIDKIWRHCEGKGSRGRTVTLKVKFSDFEIVTRSRSIPAVVSSRDERSSSCRAKYRRMTQGIRRRA